MADVDVLVRVRQLAARVERGTEEVLRFLEDGPQLRALEAAVRAVQQGQAVDVAGLAGAFARYDDLRARIRHVGKRAASSGSLPGRRSTRREIPRSGRS